MPTTHFGPWDAVLLAVVTGQATFLAYIHDPKWKAFVYAMPLPFTVASLALGLPMGITNVVGLTVLLAFTHAIRLLHQERSVSIVPSIVLSALGYCAAGSLLARALPTGDRAFWLACGLTAALALVLFLAVPPRTEPGHRSPLPVWVKAPIIAGVVVFLIVAKNTLQGFMTVFPMVGVIGAYEARHSLWTFSRQIPVMMLAMVPMMAVCRLTQDRIGLGPALMLGWVVFLGLLVPLSRMLWSAAEGEVS